MKYYAVTRKGTGDELTHWKYIKKYKGDNGKWRYVYEKESFKDSLGFDDRKEYIDQKGKKQGAELKKLVAESNMKDAYNSQKYHNKRTNQREAQKAMNNYMERSNEYVREAKKLDRLKKKYYKTPIGRVEKLANKGKRVVEALFS